MAVPLFCCHHDDAARGPGSLGVLRGRMPGGVPADADSVVLDADSMEEALSGAGPERLDRMLQDFGARGRREGLAPASEFRKLDDFWLSAVRTEDAVRALADPVAHGLAPFYDRGRRAPREPALALWLGILMEGGVPVRWRGVAGAGGPI